MSKPFDIITFDPIGIIASFPGPGNPLSQLPSVCQSELMTPVKMVPPVPPEQLGFDAQSESSQSICPSPSLSMPSAQSHS